MTAAHRPSTLRAMAAPSSIRHLALPMLSVGGVGNILCPYMVAASDLAQLPCPPAAINESGTVCRFSHSLQAQSQCVGSVTARAEGSSSSRAPAPPHLCSPSFSAVADPHTGLVGCGPQSLLLSRMGTAVSKKKALRNDTISNVAAKVRAARAFGEYLSQTHPEGQNGSDHLLIQEDSPEMLQASQNKRRLSSISDSKLERSFSEEREKLTSEGPKPRVYTISGERPMLSDHESDSMELVVMKTGQDKKHHHHHSHHHHHPLQNSGSAHNITRPCKSWSGSRQNSKECQNCAILTVPAQHSFDLEQHQSKESGWRKKKLERMYSIDKVSDDVPVRTWFPKENLFTFQTATTTMQAAFRGYAERKRRKRENDSAALIQRNFRKHLRMVGSRRMKAQTFADRRERSFSRSWSDPTPVKAESIHDSRESHDLQSSCTDLDEECEDLNWESEREMEVLSCEGDDFIPPKIMLISSKVPKAEYIPTIIRRDDSSIIPILYDHEHATFDDILEEIEKKLNVYRKGCKIWEMLIFCQGGPGYLYLLKNKVATFAKVEKEEDLIMFWKRLSKLMSKVNSEPNIIHIMGCYVLGNPNGEKLFQNLKNLMSPNRIEFKSPLELSAQGKQLIEKYFDFRLYRLWKTRQHSKLLDYDDIL